MFGNTATSQIKTNAIGVQAYLPAFFPIACFRYNVWYTFGT